MGRPRILAIAVGIVTDIVSSIVLGTIFVIFLNIVLLARGEQIDQISKEIMDWSKTATPMLLICGGIGGLGSMIGGFVTGWIARQHRVFNGLLAGIGSVLVSLVMTKDYPLWYEALGIVLTIGPAATGAFFADLVFGPVESSPPPKQIIVHP